MTTPQFIAEQRRLICASIEDIGGIATRLSELEQNHGSAHDGQALENIQEWADSAAESLLRIAMNALLFSGAPQSTTTRAEKATRINQFAKDSGIPLHPEQEAM